MSTTSLNCTSPLGGATQDFIDPHHAVLLFVAGLGFIFLYTCLCALYTRMLREQVVEQPRIDAAAVQKPFLSDPTKAKSVAAEAMTQREKMQSRKAMCEIQTCWVMFVPNDA